MRKNKIILTGGWLTPTIASIFFYGTTTAFLEKNERFKGQIDTIKIATYLSLMSFLARFGYHEANIIISSVFAISFLNSFASTGRRVNWLEYTSKTLFGISYPVLYGLFLGIETLGSFFFEQQDTSELEKLLKKISEETNRNQYIENLKKDEYGQYFDKLNIKNDEPNSLLIKQYLKKQSLGYYSEYENIITTTNIDLTKIIIEYVKPSYKTYFLISAYNKLQETEDYQKFETKEKFYQLISDVLQTDVQNINQKFFAPFHLDGNISLFKKTERRLDDSDKLELIKNHVKSFKATDLYWDACIKLFPNILSERPEKYLNSTKDLLITNGKSYQTFLNETLFNSLFENNESRTHKYYRTISKNIQSYNITLYYKERDNIQKQIKSVTEVIKNGNINDSLYTTLCIIRGEGKVPSYYNIEAYAVLSKIFTAILLENYNFEENDLKLWELRKDVGDNFVTPLLLFPNLGFVFNVCLVGIEINGLKKL
jgi:hypothetical protein